ncbi:MinD/ParA family ATP-binding protein [Halobellus limi]|mgnify:CR=1 FL=1|jgi:septum site-determining protein MinD|uniref:CDP-4-keto-6-deoxy-D-glucose-3-dehydrase n=1 Tax=Halobellus limi TaxID=699433 RepID=A0A1H5YUV7_9EURY|nr:CDP-4-keto-6-deoxy-D-glucose-3-dehydrase [Halobellus limi]QCC48323.1 CDP-4-keto-6-deoxy-D-glucose-3-dehydrase [Halobellus limi]SEG27931.1 septum site-determining protein MinD [Halobellus limi]
MFAIAGGKGGSGKTTTTLGLARAIDGPTLAVDADCDLPNLHALAGVPRAAAPGGRGHPDPASSGGDTRIVPAPRDAPDGLGSRLRRLREREAVTSPISVGDGDGYGVDSNGEPTTVLVDCPAGAGPDATVPLRVADGVLVVATPCVAALRDAAKTAAMARAVGTPVVGAVLTRARLAPPGVEDLLGCRVLGVVPPASDSRADEPLSDPIVSRAYDELAETLSDRPNT